MRQSFFDYCRLYQKQNLLDEWDAERNLPLTPQAVTYGSHTPVWWRCENGHEWEAVVYTRTHGSGCPFCAGKKAQAGFNDLATQYPELARQWDYTKNIPVLPADVTTGSHRLVWWKCEKGHSWRASIHSRASGCGCPVCAGRQILVGENDLATVDPELAQEWDTARNGKLTPQDVLPGTEKKVWWVCGHGHHWRAAVSARTNRQSGCPYCSGKLVLTGFNDLASQNPVLAAQWDTERNGTLTGHAGQQPQGMVDLREGTQLSGGHRLARQRQRLPVLHKQKSARWIQRPGDRRAAHRRRVAPDAERQSHARNGHGGQPEKGLVDVSAGARLESCHLPANRRKKMRLPRLRGQNKSRKRIKNTACHWWASIDIFNYGGT